MALRRKHCRPTSLISIGYPYKQITNPSSPLSLKDMPVYGIV